MLRRWCPMPCARPLVPGPRGRWAPPSAFPLQAPAGPDPMAGKPSRVGLQEPRVPGRLHLAWSSQPAQHPAAFPRDTPLALPSEGTLGTRRVAVPRTRWASLLGCCPSWGAAGFWAGAAPGGQRGCGAGASAQYSPSKSDRRLWAAEGPSKSPELQFMLQTAPSRPMRPQVLHRGRRRASGRWDAGERERKGPQCWSWPGRPPALTPSRHCSSAEVTPPSGAGHSPHPFLCLFLPPTPFSPQFSPFPSGPPWCLPGGGAKASGWEESWARAASVPCPQGRVGRGGHGQA